MALLRFTQLSRTFRPNVLSPRPYATSSSPLGSENPAHKQSSSNFNPIYAAIGVAAAAGSYWYYTHPEDVSVAKKKAKVEEEEMLRKGRESIDAAKAHADDAYQRGEARYGETKEQIASGRSAIDRKVQEAEGRAHKVGADAEAKYNSYKASAQKTLADARDSTEHLYNDARSTADRKAAEVRSDVEKKGEEVKASWFSWLGWGKSEAEKAKRDTAGKVANTAEDVRQRADKQA